MFNTAMAFLALLVLAFLAAAFGDSTEFAIFATGALMLAGLSERDAD